VFAQKVTKKATGDGEAEKKPTKIQCNVIQDKAVQAAAILQKTFKPKTIPEIAQAINSLDPMFEIAHLNDIKKYLPTEDDIAGINSFIETTENGASLLGVGEIWALEIHKVHNVTQKIDVMIAQRQYPEKLQELIGHVHTVDKACGEVLESKEFKKIMEYVLMFGNFLNSNTPRGGVPGFKIDTLEKLRDCKSADGKRSLLHLLIDFMEKNHPELLNFTDGLSTGIEVKNVPGAQLEADINSLEKMVRQTEGAINAVEKTDFDDKEPFLTIAKEFVGKAKDEIEALKNQFSRMKEKFAKLLKYVGENPDDKPPAVEEFFPKISNFVEAWRGGIAENKKQREEAEKKARLAEAERKRKEELAKKKATSQRKAADSEDTGVVDDIMGEVMSGVAGRRRRKFGKTTQP